VGASPLRSTLYAHGGGVLEHPTDSRAWAAHGLIAPPRGGGWVSAGDWLGWTCCVEQGHYGHRGRKATWLYAAHAMLPSLRWGPSEASVHVTPAPMAQAKSRAAVEYMGAQERRATPPAFRDLLLSMARCVLKRRKVA
jgi:hypothetical protein